MNSRFSKLLLELSDEDFDNFLAKEDLKKKEQKARTTHINRIFSDMSGSKKAAFLKKAFCIKGAYPSQEAYDIYYTAKEYGDELSNDEILKLKLNNDFIDRYYKYHNYIFGMMIGQGSVPIYYNSN